MTPPILLLALALCPFAGAGAQTVADSAGIRQAALDYIEGWYAGDGARMDGRWVIVNVLWELHPRQP